MFIEDGVLYSYGYHYPMARWVSRHVLLINNKQYSVTTDQHLRNLIWMVEDTLICPVPNVKAESGAEHLENLSAVFGNLTSLGGKVLRSRENKTWRVRDLLKLLRTRNDYADYLVAAGLIPRRKVKPLKLIDCYMQSRS